MYYLEGLIIVIFQLCINSMKGLVFYIIVAFYLCGLISSCALNLEAMSTEKVHNNKFEISINYPKNDIYRGEIEIVIKNISEEMLEISSPRCWVNSLSFLSDINGKSISPVKIKLNPECLDDFILIHPEGTCKVFYNYSLADLYPHLNSGLYDIYFSYQGKIKNEKGGCVKLANPLISPKKRIEIFK